MIGQVEGACIQRSMPTVERNLLGVRSIGGCNNGRIRLLFTDRCCCCCTLFLFLLESNQVSFESTLLNLEALLHSRTSGLTEQAFDLVNIGIDLDESNR